MYIIKRIEYVSKRQINRHTVNEKQGNTMNILVFGAHPDDCEFFCGGTAVKLTGAGHRVMFVSVTNGDAGHMSKGPGDLARIRRAETAAADTFLGVEWQVLNNHDGRLTTDVSIREDLIRIIRNFKADVVISHRSCDYHPDHRNTGILVQDTAYMVIVPNICPETPALVKNPLYLYLWDEITGISPFSPDIIVPIDDVFDKKIRALHRMTSQFYEWLPYTFGTLDSVPESETDRLVWLEAFLRGWMKNPYPEETVRRYDRSAEVIEAFQVCPFGRKPSPGELEEVFPFARQGIRFE